MSEAAQTQIICAIIGAVEGVSGGGGGGQA
jgi:hypothetical protein